MSNETYLGTSRADAYVPTQQIKPNQTASYTFASGLDTEEITLAGTWQISPERIIAKTGAQLRLNFLAQQVYLVMSNESQDGILPSYGVFRRSTFAPKILDR